MCSANMIMYVWWVRNHNFRLYSYKMRILNNENIFCLAPGSFLSHENIFLIEYQIGIEMIRRKKCNACTTFLFGYK